jgi:hypothetical protein
MTFMTDKEHEILKNLLPKLEKLCPPDHKKYFDEFTIGTSVARDLILVPDCLCAYNFGHIPTHINILLKNYDFLEIDAELYRYDKIGKIPQQYLTQQEVAKKILSQKQIDFIKTLYNF